MTEETDKRVEKRQNLRVNVTYEKILEKGDYDIPVTAPIRDISMTGLSFYSQEKIEVNSFMRVTLSISKDEEVNFKGRVTRIMLSGKEDAKYLIGTNIEDIDPEKMFKLKAFLKKLDIDNILDSIELDNVVDVNFIMGYPPVIKKMGKLFIWGEDSLDEYVLKNMLLATLDD